MKKTEKTECWGRRGKNISASLQAAAGTEVVPPGTRTPDTGALRWYRQAHGPRTQVHQGGAARHTDPGHKYKRRNTLGTHCSWRLKLKLTNIQEAQIREIENVAPKGGVWLILSEGLGCLVTSTQQRGRKGGHPKRKA